MDERESKRERGRVGEKARRRAGEREREGEREGQMEKLIKGLRTCNKWCGCAVDRSESRQAKQVRPPFAWQS